MRQYTYCIVRMGVVEVLGVSSLSGSNDMQPGRQLKGNVTLCGMIRASAYERVDGV